MKTCWLRKIQPNTWTTSLSVSSKWVSCFIRVIYDFLLQSEAVIIPLCSLFICSILKYSLSPTSTVGIIYIRPGCLFLPIPPPPLSPFLSILISFALPMVIYLPDLYLSTANKLGYHAPPLPYSFSSSSTLYLPPFLLFPPPHPSLRLLRLLL